MLAGFVQLNLVRPVLLGALLLASRAGGAQSYAVVDLGTFGGPTSCGSGINGVGDVVGAAYDAGAASRAHAFLYHGGTMADLGTLGGQSSSARAVNDSRDVAGVAENAALTPHAFLYR